MNLNLIHCNNNILLLFLLSMIVPSGKQHYNTHLAKISGPETTTNMVNQDRSKRLTETVGINVTPNPWARAIRIIAEIPHPH